MTSDRLLSRARAARRYAARGVVALLVVAMPLVRAGAQAPAAPTSHPPLHVELSLTAGALRLTKAEGGGEYLRERLKVGAANAVVEALGMEGDHGDRRPEDEVYFLVFGRGADGEPFSRIVSPSGSPFWRTYRVGRGDDGDRHELDDVPLWDGELHEGGTLALSVAVLEFDGEGAGGPLTRGDGLAAAIHDRLERVRDVGLRLAERDARGADSARVPGVVRGALAGALGADVDDVIGAMRVEVRAVAGRPQATWQPLDDARDKGHSRFVRGRPLEPRWFQLGGDGARYEAHLRVSAR